MTIRPPVESPASVLIVDDDAPTRRMFRELLETQNYVVVEADDGRTALQILEFENVGLVLLDMMMSGLDGPEVCSIMRGRAHRPYLPVVMISGLADRASRVRAKEAGADDYFVKPVDTLELLIRVEALYRNRATIESFSSRAACLTQQLAEMRAQLDRAAEMVNAADLAFRELIPLSTALRTSVDSLRRFAPQGDAEDSTWKALDEHLASLARVAQTPRSS